MQIYTYIAPQINESCKCLKGGDADQEVYKGFIYISDILGA